MISTLSSLLKVYARKSSLIRLKERKIKSILKRTMTSSLLDCKTLKLEAKLQWVKVILIKKNERQTRRISNSLTKKNSNMNQFRRIST